MTEDRINELRDWFEHEHPVCECLDEIERLRAALKKIRDGHRVYVGRRVIDGAWARIARKALGG